MKVKKKSNIFFNNYFKKNRKLIFIIIFFFVLIFEVDKKKNIIPIVFALNNEYTYPLIVTLTSILYNASNTTYYYFYIMIPGDFLRKNIKLILGLKKLYPNCKIKFINLKNKYSGWKIRKHYSISTYYRLSISSFINNFDKIIYLDCDTLIHKDLLDFYNLNMKGNYYMGLAAQDIRRLVINGTRNFIGAGVLLINLIELKKINAPYLFEKYYKKYGTKKEDEYLINAVFYNKIGFLPFKFGIPDFDNKLLTPIKFWYGYHGHSNGTLKELIEAAKDPTITHEAYTLKKWWERNYNKLTKIGKKWIYYAYKSNAFDDICKAYKQYINICNKIKLKKNYDNYF